MVERIGYPESILNDTELDGMYKKVNFSHLLIAPSPLIFVDYLKCYFLNVIVLLYGHVINVS